MDFIRIGLVTLLLSGCQMTQASTSSGKIEWLETCPGDATAVPYDLDNVLELDPPDKAGAVELSSVLITVLSSLGSAIVSNGLNLAGETLKETAEEKVVDTLHYGDSKLYAGRTHANDNDPQGLFANAKLVFNSRCLVVMSKSTKNTKNEANKALLLQQMSESYLALNKFVGESDMHSTLNRGDESVVDEKDTEEQAKTKKWKPGNDALAEFLDKRFAGNSVPGLVAVIDIVPSSTLDSFRFESRYVAVDHSIRERRRDSKKRDFTLNINLSSPGTASSISTLLKYSGIKRGSPFQRYSEGSSVVNSSWKVYPKLTKTEQKKADVFTGSSKKLSASADSYSKLATQSALQSPPHGIQLITPDSANFNYCRLNDDQLTKLLQRARNQLEKIHREQQRHVLKAPPEDATDVVKDAYFKQTKALELYEGYWRSCADYYTSRGRLEKYTDDSNQFAFSVGVFDTNIDIKEFRDRELIKFLGGVLSSESLRSELGALAAKEIKGEESPSSDELNTEFEAAIVEVEVALGAHLDIPTALTLATLNAKKRAANRIAVKQGRPLPYPEAGVWGF